MNEQELLKLYTMELNRPIYVARVDLKLAAAIESRVEAVWLSPFTMSKQLTKHRNLTFDEYRMLPIAIRYGDALRDSYKHLNFVYHDDVWSGESYKVTVKTVSFHDALYIESFHRLRGPDVARLHRRGTLIRPHYK